MSANQFVEPMRLSRSRLRGFLWVCALRALAHGGVGQITMSPAIPTITALHALVTKLVESIQDRKFAGELRDVQRLVGALQSEHFAIQQESFELKAKNSELEKSVALFTQRVAESDAKALADAKRIEELVAQVGSLRVANEEWSRRFQEGGTGGGWGSDEDEYTTPPRG